MRIEEVKVYKFEELTKEVQEKVIEKWYEQENYPFLSESLEESLLNNEKNIFEDGFKLWYSLSYSHGDGLSIEGDIDIEKILNLLSVELKEKFTGKIYRLFSTGNKGRYSFHSIQDIKFELDLSDDDDYDELDQTFEEKVLPVVWEIYGDLCVDLKKEGYSEIEYRPSIEEFTDLCKANNYEFYEDGKMF